MFGKTTLGILAAFGLSSAASAAPVTDCPLRDAPFSVASPLVDILLSPAAKAVANEATGNALNTLPPIFGSKPPTFAAILTVKELVGRFGGGKQIDEAALDTKLRAIPVTDADRLARCSRYDNDRPQFKLGRGKPRILLFEKINGFKDVPSVNAAHAALVAMAERRGWELAITDKAGAFTPSTLRQFDAVLWNNISGDVLTLSQRAAFERWMNRGGAFVGVHGTAGDPVYFWDWYVDRLIGARFLGHPMNPQFQDARVVVADTAHAATKGLPAEWTMNEEWYSFKNNPRAGGAHIIATLDESTYKPEAMGASMRMGTDHPIAWTRCVGKGRMFYTAIGHKPENYSQPQAAALLEEGINWAVTAKKACPAG